MIDTVLIVIVFYAGFAFGAWVNRKPPKVEARLVVSQEFIDQIAQERVMAWLDQRGLTWMPRGAMFNHDKAKKE